MKYILPFIIIFSLVSTGLAWPWDRPTSKPTPVATPAPTPKPTISAGRELVKEISKELKGAKEENSKLKESLSKALKRVENAEAQTQIVQKQADELKEWGIIQQEQAQKFIEKYNKAVKRYHRLKMLAAIIAAAAGVFFGLQFMNLAPPPYNLGVPVGAAGLFAALVWFFL